MKKTINEILEEAFKDGPISYQSQNANGKLNSFEDYILRGDDLLKFEREIKDSDLFKEADLKFINVPSFVLDKKIYTAQTVKITDQTKFKGECFLYSLSWTPEIYDPNTFCSFKDGEKIHVTPLMYSPEDFKAYKDIILKIDIEDLKDKDVIFGKNNNPARKEYHDLLDDALENPDKYKVKGKRGILVRGIFEVFQQDSETSRTIDIEKSKMTESFTVFFMEANLIKKSLKSFGEKLSNNDAAEIELRMASRAIPEVLREDFLKKFDLKDLMDTTKIPSLKDWDPNKKSKAQQIDDFLNENHYQIVT